MNTKENSIFKIETVKTSDGNEMSFSEVRGGIITSIKFHDKEVLFFDKETFYNPDPAISVKGGVPILFPSIGPIESSLYPGMKQHGFARNAFNWIAEKTKNGFKETLMTDEEKLKCYPFKFRDNFSGEFSGDTFVIEQKIENLEENTDLPICMGLHPFFYVPMTEKMNVKFNFEGGKSAEKQFEKWANGDYIVIDNPNTVMEVVIPNMHTLLIEASPEYKKIWIWSTKDKDYICVEPMMGIKNGLIDNPTLIKPGDSFLAKLSIRLK